MMSDFVYWDASHYEFKEVSGSEEACMKAFNEELQQYPNMQYGTTVYAKEFDKAGQCRVTIKRFKTKDLCRKHCQFPPTYVREGKVL